VSPRFIFPVLVVSSVSHILTHCFAVMQALPTFVHSIHVNGDRVFVGDMAESVHFLKFKRSDNALVVFADDYSSRYLTSTVYVDYNTIAGADKFGNVFVLRLPKEVCTMRARLLSRRGGGGGGVVVVVVVVVVVLPDCASVSRCVSERWHCCS
jgi:hypothetical protein